VHFRFSKYIPQNTDGDPFQRLLKLFLQLLTFTKQDAAEALSWMNELDKEHQFTYNEYGMGDFIRELKEKGYLREDPVTGNFEVTEKTNQTIRKNALEEIFGKLRKTKSGNHKTFHTGTGEEISADSRQFQFGDNLDSINVTTTLQNAQINHGIDELTLTEDDLEINEREHKSLTSTVLMIDISHSMILYGEDRITPAKKVAMALAELITTKYPKDTLDIIVFGDDAWPVEIKDLPYLQVGPYHTNTVAGLELAMEILRKKKSNNKQIFMITDGKPTCIKEKGQYYQNSFGIDRKILNKTLNLAAQCQRVDIPITTFMIARDPYLQAFVRDFTQTNNGRAFYSSLDGLGEFLFEDYIRNKKKIVR
jgi:Ca-activated chloride channel homolog